MTIGDLIKTKDYDYVSYRLTLPDGDDTFAGCFASQGGEIIPLDADDVDSNTDMMEYAIGKGYIITREVFGLNDKPRPFAENWVKWANENKDKAVSILH